MIKVQVTAEHIKNGIQCTPQKCPVALAIKDAVPQWDFVTVGNDRFSSYIGDALVKEHSPLPMKISKFIRAFDKSPSSVKPISFTIKE